MIICVDMKLKKYKAKFKIETTYAVDFETPDDPFTEEGHDNISNMIIEDYEVGNMDSEGELDCQFSIYDYEEIEEKK